MTGFHLRRANRYQVSIPVSYWWTCPQEPIHSGTGETRNISDSGVLVAAKECPPIGAAIQITILLPRLRGSGYGMKLYGEGMVVRIEELDPHIESKPARSFAASVQFYPESTEKSVQPEHNRVEKHETTVQ